ncbi:DNA-binding protein YbaB [Streptosporangium album]|uniref:DNA-binding protein YbaB n=1 Tax=Streptosporangium album TaxID=47479 RepID=A0A7W7RWT6_9ACTN|nr:YbaB/EbfC family nucleoid-associated protein [Streptosporangium album]MBB4939681.1 DNA-binding protein YbaB [Streptosporangium album]
MDETDRLRMLTERLEQLERRSATLAEAGAAAEQWVTREFTGKVDKGGITATVDASGNLLALDISQLSKRRHDGVTLGDAVLEAIHKAEQAASEARATLMGDLGVDLGVDLGDLFGDAKRFFEADGGPHR